MRYGYKDSKNRYIRKETPVEVKRSEVKGHVYRSSGQKPKKLLTVMSSFLVLFILAGCGTWAVLSAVTPTLTNPFTMGDTTVIIEENFAGWTVKQVQLKNGAGEDHVDGIVRASLVPIILDANGSDGRPANAGSMAAPTGNTMVMGDFTFVLASNWSTNWFYKDGYFYYRSVLAPGASTTRLLEKVQLTNSTPATIEQYKNYTITVEVLADILQATDAAAQDAWGVKVTGTTVTPAP